MAMASKIGTASESILVKGSKVVSYDNSGGSEILCSPVRGKVLCGISLYN